MLYNDKGEQLASESSAASTDREFGILSRAPQASVWQFNSAPRKQLDGTPSLNAFRTYHGGYGTGDFSNVWWTAYSSAMIDQRQELIELCNTNAAKSHARWTYS